MGKGNKVISKRSPADIKDRKQNRLIYSIIILLSFVLYGQTMWYDYALDDSIVIKKNEFTKQGTKGIGDILSNDTFVGFFGKQKNLVAGGRYRPLSVVTFAIEYQMFGLRPGISHFINILLYAMTGILLFRILSYFFSKYSPKKWYLGMPFLTTIIFLAHPVHTEVVANIKGRDEIMTFLGSLLALWYTLKYLDSKQKKYLFYSGLSFFLAFLSKENTVTFLLVIPLSVYFFTNHKLKDNLISLLPLLASTIVFLVIRQAILGSFSAPVAKELLNNPFLNATNGEKFATIFYTFLIYLKLLIFPHPLTYDYYPKQIPIIGWGDIRAWGSLLLYFVLGIYAIVQMKKKSIISFSIIFFIATLSVVSNLVFPVGTFMNERFIYISSLGFVLIVAYFLSEKLPSLIKDSKIYVSVTTVFIAVLLLAFTAKSIARNQAWKDDYTLFTTDVDVSTNSAKGNAAAASLYREKALATEDQAERDVNYNLAIKYFTKAIDVYPGYFDVALDLAVVHFKYNGNIDKSEEYLIKAFNINYKNPKVLQFINAIFNELNQPPRKLDFYLKLDNIRPGLYDIKYSIGSIYGKDLGNIPKSIEYLSEAVKINPNGIEAYKDLGVAYGFIQNYEMSIKMSEKAIQLNPKDAQVYINIGLNYRNMGNEAKASEYFALAAKFDPKFKAVK